MAYWNIESYQFQIEAVIYVVTLTSQIQQILLRHLMKMKGHNVHNFSLKWLKIQI